jgi:threonine dehydrogenase-like Zn-dependent dehydrogenase
MYDHQREYRNFYGFSFHFHHAEQTVNNVNRSVDIVYAEEPAIIKPTDVKVKIAFASICGFDIMMIKL